MPVPTPTGSFLEPRGRRQLSPALRSVRSRRDVFPLPLPGAVGALASSQRDLAFGPFWAAEVPDVLRTAGALVAVRQDLAPSVVRALGNGGRVASS